MTRRALVLLGCLGVLAPGLGLPPAADARTERRDVQTRASGTVVIQFAGDPATGCAEAGLCGVQGTVTVEPGDRGQLGLHEQVAPRRGRPRVSLFLGGDGGRVTAQVRRTLPDGSTEVCGDARGGFFTAETRAARDASAVELRFGSGRFPSDLTTTTCAGPLPVDVAAALPGARVPLAVLRRGNATVDLGGERPFAAGGLKGTVRSTLSLRLGASRVQRSRISPPGPRGRRRAPRRRLSVRYDIERVTGGVRSQLGTDADPARCAGLDVCGLGGTVTETLAGDSGELRIDATGPASRVSARDLRAAVGLTGGGGSPRVSVSGFATWRTRGGRVSASLARGGQPDCASSAALDEGFLDLRQQGGRYTLGYGGFGAGGLRTRCPGPFGFDSPARATGTADRSAFRGRRVTLRLTRGRTVASSPFSLASSTDLTLVLRRTRIVESTR